MAVRYSVWIIPNGKAYKTLHDEVRSLSVKYYLPFIKPHISLVETVLDSYDHEGVALLRTLVLADNLNPFRVKLEDLVNHDKPTDSLALRADGYKSLQDAQRTAVQAFGLVQVCYAPVLEINTEGVPSEEQTKLLEELRLKRGSSFIANGIHLFWAEDGSKNWNSAGEFKLNKSSGPDRI